MSTSADTIAKMKQSPYIQRRGNKPLIEKRRRARINECLLQLKNLVLNATNTEITRTGKLEKADILEMTVEYLKKINPGQGRNQNLKEDNGSIYLSGYEKCLEELVKFINKTKGFNDEIKQKITKHCKNKLQEKQLQTVEKTNDENVSTTNSRLLEDSSDSDTDFPMESKQPSEASVKVNALSTVSKEIKIELTTNETIETRPRFTQTSQHVSGSLKLVCGGDIFIIMDQHTSNGMSTTAPAIRLVPSDSTHPVQNILIPYKPASTDLSSSPSYSFCGVANGHSAPFAPIPFEEKPLVSQPCLNNCPVNIVNGSGNISNALPVWRPW